MAREAGPEIKTLMAELFFNDLVKARETWVAQTNAAKRVAKAVPPRPYTETNNTGDSTQPNPQGGQGNGRGRFGHSRRNVWRQGGGRGPPLTRTHGW